MADLNSAHILFSMDLNKDNILKILRSVIINKTHHHGNISIRMVKICDKNLVKALSIIYERCLKLVYSQKYGKNLILFKFIKKGDKQLNKILEQFFCYLFIEHFLRNFYSIKTFECLQENKLLFENQSGM